MAKCMLHFLTLRGSLSKAATTLISSAIILSSQQTVQDCPLLFPHYLMYHILLTLIHTSLLKRTLLSFSSISPPFWHNLLLPNSYICRKAEKYLISGMHSIASPKCCIAHSVFPRSSHISSPVTASIPSIFWRRKFLSSSFSPGRNLQRGLTSI